MGIYRTTDPTAFDDVDGIIINESAPAPNIAGVAANVAILVGQCQRGPHTLTEVGSIGEFHEIFGKSSTHGVNLALKNKKFGRLKILRVQPNSSAKAAYTFESSGAVDIITFTAKYVGAYGNSIKVTVESGSTTGKKYTIQDTSTDAVLPAEVYDNVVITAVGSTFAASNLVDVTVVATSAEPANAAATSLASGSDGSVADADYETAIAVAEQQDAGNVIFLDVYTTARNGYLEAHVALVQDKMAILCGPEAQTVAEAITDVASYRDTDGRLIYAYPWVETTINGASTMTAPASWLASIISQTAPSVDPAYSKNVGFTTGATGLKKYLSRANFISLKDAGVCAFELDNDLGGIKPKSGVVTQIVDTSKVMILRRRMADFLTNSAAKFLKNYQNAVNSKENRTLVKGALVSFVESLERDGVLPKDADVKEGKAKLIDTESLNTDASIAAGFFKILWRQRIYSSMRYLVLNAEIGESVVVTES